MRSSTIHRTGWAFPLAAALFLSACTAGHPEAGSTAAPHTSAPATGPAATTTAAAPSASPSPDARELARLNTRLQQAAANNDAAEITGLLARGADLEVRDGNGRTPLVTATKANNVEAARVLIEAGADVNAKDNIEDSAFLYAGAEGFDQILLLTLEHGAELDSTNRFGGTALIPACEHAHTSTVRILLEAGVDPDHVNEPGWTCLLEAVIFGTGGPDYQDVVRQLITAGADLNIPDANGVTARQHAEALGQQEIAGLLARAGAR